MNPVLLWLSRRSLRFLHALGGALGWTAYLLSAGYRHRLRDNAALAGVSEADLRASVAEAGRLYMELPRLWLRPRSQPIADPVQWQGAELVEELLAQGRGLVLLTPHLGCFEVAGQGYAERFGAIKPMTVLYRPARQAWLRELEETARARDAMVPVPANLAGVRLMLRALKRGETVGLLPDQVPPHGMGVWAPFFGKPAYTMTLAARLVLQTGASVCLIWAVRLPRGAGYRIELAPLAQPLPAREGLDEDEWTRAAATAINRSMEAVIARSPTQYLWGYHRYKSPRQVDSA
ncbi:Lipid A biosynthesis lauroyl acyltransferase [Rubrivivax sp. A210]|uniref:lysophospholipid acyltransferase family protein n=1 Tax=Rubrivivax sp. A210 TaxID=2772301 RepID=UPI0019191DB6|nr:lysophospholipid acyltransferase family protein [Rubrivivax sp. A210]CAD5374215.1 Lipid A biosynthesis lauroyl acyltransferase [Rubrivivax sp. A210]